MSTCASGACPEDRIVELDWNGSTTVAGLELICTEARHFSGRYFYRDTTLWASWVVAGPAHRVFFGGDTGYTPAFAEIGARLGPFDLTLLPVGAYNDAWHAIHMDPEEAMRAHGDLGGRVFLPIHWATFNLAFHRWAEPAQRVCAAAERVRRAGRHPPARPAGRRAEAASAHGLVDGGRLGRARRRTATPVSAAPSSRGRSPACWRSCRAEPGVRWVETLKFHGVSSKVERLQPHRVRLLAAWQNRRSASRLSR